MATTIDVPVLDTVNLSGINPRYSWKISELTKTKTIYEFILTGDADNTTDLKIPIESCQMRRRNGKPTYMSVVIPKYDEYVDAIINRSNGKMVLYKGYRFTDNSTQTEKIATVNLEDIRLDKGPINRSITLSGHKTVSNDAPKKVNINKVTYKNTNASGLRRYRSAVDLWVRPGDTAVMDGEEITVGLITYTIQKGQEVMEIEEAEG